MSISLNVVLEEVNSTLGVSLGVAQIVPEYIGGETYKGDYLVKPKVTEQTIPTRDKVMLDDVTIEPIPFFNVSNTSGGTTAYIGNEV